MALARYSFNRNESGFSLAEVVVATAMMATSLVALAQLLAISTQSNRTARYSTLASMLAAQKMEQLRGLTWGFDAIGLPLTDTTTNTAVIPETPTGGTGLAPSPGDSLTRNADGYVDYVDANGNLLGGGPAIRGGTAYIRRWSIEPLPTNPNNTLVIQVLVTPFRNRGNADSGSVARAPQEARLLSVKTRKTI
jgi:type II secretory pathway pseudopilin PulG